jgi:hypothetical protein
MGYVDPVLVCRDCAPVCKMEEEFLRNQLKSLINGEAVYNTRTGLWDWTVELEVDWRWTGTFKHYSRRGPGSRDKMGGH